MGWQIVNDEQSLSHRFIINKTFIFCHLQFITSTDCKMSFWTSCVVIVIHVGLQKSNPNLATSWAHSFCNLAISFWWGLFFSFIFCFFFFFIIKFNLVFKWVAFYFSNYTMSYQMSVYTLIINLTSKSYILILSLVRLPYHILFHCNLVVFFLQGDFFFFWYTLHNILIFFFSNLL